jgi:hypothetical protein
MACLFINRSILIFKLEEEENTALLLHLPALFAETADFGSVSGLGCWLVVATAQAVYSCLCDWFRLRQVAEKAKQPFFKLWGGLESSLKPTNVENALPTK